MGDLVFRTTLTKIHFFSTNVQFQDFSGPEKQKLELHDFSGPVGTLCSSSWNRPKTIPLWMTPSEGILLSCSISLISHHPCSVIIQHFIQSTSSLCSTCPNCLYLPFSIIKLNDLIKHTCFSSIWLHYTDSMYKLIKLCSTKGTACDDTSYISVTVCCEVHRRCTSVICCSRRTRLHWAVVKWTVSWARLSARVVVAVYHCLCRRRWTTFCNRTTSLELAHQPCPPSHRLTYFLSIKANAARSFGSHRAFHGPQMRA